MSDAYLQGFIDKCAEHGVDPEELAKWAEEAGGSYSSAQPPTPAKPKTPAIKGNQRILTPNPTPGIAPTPDVVGAAMNVPGADGPSGTSTGEISQPGVGGPNDSLRSN
jgi:hypothetical protein